MKTASEALVAQAVQPPHLQALPPSHKAQVSLPQTAATENNETRSSICEARSVSMRALTKIMTSAKESNLSCIGITGITPACGASQIASSLAQAFSTFGQTVLLVLIAPKSADASPARIDVVNEHLAVIKLGAHQLRTSPTAQNLRDLLGKETNKYERIVVDLPVVYPNEGKFDIILKEIGSLCDASYLVCETAGHTRTTLANAVDFCRLSDVKLAGWILNDRRLKFRNLVSDQ